MKYLSILALLVMSACGSAPKIDPAFQPFVSEWNQTYPDHQVNVDVQFADLSSEDAAGLWDGQQVSIDTKFWADAFNTPEKQQVLFHEFGHAMFGYGHDFLCLYTSDFTTTSECEILDAPWASVSDFGLTPRSIMYPYVFGEDAIYPYYLNYYFKQLGSCTTCTNPANGVTQARFQERSQSGRKRID